MSLNVVALAEMKLSRGQRERLAEILRGFSSLDEARKVADALTINGRVQTHLGAPTRSSVLRAVLAESEGVDGWTPRADLIDRALARCDADTNRKLLDGSLRALVKNDEVEVGKTSATTMYRLRARKG